VIWRVLESVLDRLVFRPVEAYLLAVGAMAQSLWEILVSHTLLFFPSIAFLAVSKPLTFA
jgi:hypothetical protein